MSTQRKPPKTTMDSPASTTEPAIAQLNILFVGSRLHPNYSDFLRELGREATVRVLVSTFFDNDDFEGLDRSTFPPSFINRVRRRFHQTQDGQLERFLFRRNSPTLVWLTLYMRKNRINTVIARRHNRALHRKVKIASLLSSATVFTFRQDILHNNTKIDRCSIWPLKKGDLDQQRSHNYVPLGISIPPGKSEIHPAQKDTGTIRLISVGKFVERKGHRLVFDAVDLIRDQLSIKLDIFGSYGGSTAEYRHALQEEIYQRGLEKFIELKPTLTRSEMMSNYEHYDAYLFAGWSNSEAQLFADTYERADGTNGTMLFSMIEAMSIGLPVICSSDKKVVGSVENGVNGLVFESGNSKDLARAIRSLSNLDLGEMGEQSFRIASERHDVKKLSASFARLALRYIPSRLRPLRHILVTEKSVRQRHGLRRCSEVNHG